MTIRENCVYNFYKTFCYCSIIINAESITFRERSTTRDFNLLILIDGRKCRLSINWLIKSYNFDVSTFHILFRWKTLSVGINITGRKIQNINDADMELELFWHLLRKGEKKKKMWNGSENGISSNLDESRARPIHYIRWFELHMEKCKFCKMLVS